MTTTTHLLSILSVACLGLFAGAMLTEGLVLVPHWRSIPAPDFFAWYRANGDRLVDFFGPVTWLAAIGALVAAATALWTHHPGRWPALIAAALMLAAVATFFLYFGRANASFMTSTADLPSELGRWASWHWARTALSLGALGAALTSLALSRA